MGNSNWSSDSDHHCRRLWNLERQLLNESAL
ncbi:hypothetical protein T01_12615 [Trichinella spiralis]|uniref:Uncharacterized protein n=1 Tax=Trichinella spiralis TaxID=6334 RepID=A0A0V0YQA2_TRISP|nr:hypothetical protein T01_12615 [Trichinella spiralis]